MQKRKNRPAATQRPPQQQQSQQQPRTVAADGVYNNPIFIHAVSSQLGNTVHLQTKSGAIYEGIFTTFSPQFNILLEMAHRVEKDNENINVETVVEKYIFKPCDIVSMVAKDVDPEFATRDTFEIDTAISSRYNGTHMDQKPLERWDSAGDSLDNMCLELDSNANGWDADEMFQKNEAMYGVQSTFDHSLAGYTMQIQKSDSHDFRKAEMEAEKIAREIEKQTLYDAEIENGDEEAQFAAVVRPQGQSPHNFGGNNSNARDNKSGSAVTTNTSQKYVPPAKRKQGQQMGKLITPQTPSPAAQAAPVNVQPSTPQPVSTPPPTAQQQQQQTVTQQPPPAMPHGPGPKGGQNNNSNAGKNYNSGGGQGGGPGGNAGSYGPNSNVHNNAPNNNNNFGSQGAPAGQAPQVPAAVNGGGDQGNMQQPQQQQIQQQPPQQPLPPPPVVVAAQPQPNVAMVPTNTVNNNPPPTHNVHQQGGGMGGNNNNKPHGHQQQQHHQNMNRHRSYHPPPQQQQQQQQQQQPPPPTHNVHQQGGGMGGNNNNKPHGHQQQQHHQNMNRHRSYHPPPQQQQQQQQQQQPPPSQHMPPNMAMPPHHMAYAGDLQNMGPAPIQPAHMMLKGQQPHTLVMVPPPAQGQLVVVQGIAPGMPPPSKIMNALPPRGRDETVQDLKNFQDNYVLAPNPNASPGLGGPPQQQQPPPPLMYAPVPPTAGQQPPPPPQQGPVPVVVAGAPVQEDMKSQGVPQSPTSLPPPPLHQGARPGTTPSPAANNNNSNVAAGGRSDGGPTSGSAGQSGEKPVAEAKKSVLNPQAKPFTPRNPSTPNPSRPHTPQSAGPQIVQSSVPAGAVPVGQPTYQPPYMMQAPKQAYQAGQRMARYGVHQATVQAATGSPITSYIYPPHHPQQHFQTPHYSMIRMYPSDAQQSMQYLTPGTHSTTPSPGTQYHPQASPAGSGPSQPFPFVIQPQMVGQFHPNGPPQPQFQSQIILMPAQHPNQ